MLDLVSYSDGDWIVSCVKHVSIELTQSLVHARIFKAVCFIVLVERVKLVTRTPNQNDRRLINSGNGSLLCHDLSARLSFTNEAKSSLSMNSFISLWDVRES